MVSSRKRILVALVPVAVLVALLALDISVFGVDSILGASQVALLVAGGVCIALSALLYKTPWKRFEEAVKGHVGDVAGAILILLLIGAISGTWTAGGIVPAFIYYGLQIISPKVFLLTACLLCAIVSVMTGSSWTTIATVGVALLGIGRAEGFSDAMTAGAIIRGPISETRFLPCQTLPCWHPPSTAYRCSRISASCCSPPSRPLPSPWWFSPPWGCRTREWTAGLCRCIPMCFNPPSGSRPGS